MSFASFAIGSNDVVATSIAASTAVFSISAIRTNAIASRRDQLELVHPGHEGGDEHERGDAEVDRDSCVRARG